jgi:hypothetical protein
MIRFLKNRFEGLFREDRSGGCWWEYFMVRIPGQGDQRQHGPQDIGATVPRFNGGGLRRYRIASAKPVAAQK